jgi:hypothetical protein
MKSKQKLTQKRRSSKSGAPAADFKLEDWYGPTRELRFVG